VTHGFLSFSGAEPQLITDARAASPLLSRRVKRAEQIRVVVADDHRGFGDAATAILARTCDVVATVRDGRSAIAATSEFNPDVVVLDVAMPGLDGFQTASRIHASGSSARIVFLSNFAGDDFVLAGVTRGASGFVSKSQMVHDLAEAVSHVAEGRSFVPSASVLPQWRRAAGHRHDLLPYTTDEVLVDAVMGFFDSALDAGDSIVAVVTAPHRKALDAEFRRRGVDIAAMAASGRYTAVDSAAALESILADGIPDGALFAAAMDTLVERGLSAAMASTPHVTIFGEIAPLLCARGNYDAMLRLEQIAGDYLAARPASILCCYSTGCFDNASVYAGVCGEHSTVVSANPTR
jgi:DNA-binding NarL/FixJ family response regulator